MSNFSAFLHPVAAEDREVLVSHRFIRRDDMGNPVLDEAGKPVPMPFKIRALTQEENDQITREATRQVKWKGQTVDKLDSADFARRMVVEATVVPDFRSTEVCSAYGVLDPLMVPGKMLLSGEFSRLLQAITELSGFDTVEDQVKN